MNIKFINYVENRLTKSYYPRREYAIETKRNAQFFLCVCCVCCQCLCCCYCFCCCTFWSCWHIDSGIRKNACTTRIHSETRYSHGALTGELDQIEVFPPSLSLSTSLPLLHAHFFAVCQSLSAKE